jgi:hypothetical protein
MSEIQGSESGDVLMTTKFELLANYSKMKDPPFWVLKDFQGLHHLLQLS